MKTPTAKILDVNKNDNDGSTEIEVKLCGEKFDVIVKGGAILDIGGNMSDLSEAAQAVLDATAEELAAKYR